MPNQITSAGIKLGGLLRESREASGLSVERLARRVGYARSVLEHFEAGCHTPSRFLLAALLAKAPLSRVARRAYRSALDRLQRDRQAKRKARAICAKSKELLAA